MHTCYGPIDLAVCFSFDVHTEACAKSLTGLLACMLDTFSVIVVPAHVTDD